MPIIRVDVPDWATRAQMADIRKSLQACIESTWAREHIWIAVRGAFAEPNEATVILTVDLRDGRGQEKERTKALFDEALEVFNSVLGTKENNFILLVRKFGQDECISGGAELPALSQLTPVLRNGRNDEIGVA
jgi:hypothetical protein